MTSPDIFTDRRSDKEPVIKPKVYASTQIVHDLIQSISDSTDIKIASDRGKRVLRNVRTLNKTGAVRQVNFTELKELEMELLDARRFRKMGVNEMEVCLYSTKLHTFFIWIAAFLTFLHCHWSEKPIESFKILLSVGILFLTEFIRFLIALSPLFRYFLIHDGPLKPAPIVKIEDNEKTAEEITEELLKEQIKLIDLYSEEVLPLKRKYEQLWKWQMCYKILGYLTILCYIFICCYCFWTRYQDGSEDDGGYLSVTLALTIVCCPLWFAGYAVSLNGIDHR